MSYKKILILKNDRTGDLLVSINAINRILNKHSNDKITIFLSKINYKFGFFFKDVNKKIFNFDLNLFEKIKIFFYFLINRIDTVYILTPKNFYFYLPLFFKKTKFYGLTIKSKKNRPNEYLKNKLFKYVTLDRVNLKKRLSSYQVQENLIEKSEISKNLINVKEKINHNFKLPKKYLFFHYKHKLFNELLNWDLKQIEILLDLFSKNYENVVFSSDINAPKINKYFIQKFNHFDFINKNEIKTNDKNIYYLHEIDGYNLFNTVNNSSKVICPEGIISHLGYFCKKDTTALLHFNINNRGNLIDQLISCKEWFPPNNYKFCVLKKNFNQSLNKLNKRIS